MSFAGSKLLGVRVDRTTTTLEHKLGEVIVQNDGSIYRYIKAGEALAAYKPVDYTSAWVASVTDNGDVMQGVAQTAIASGSYGWVLEKGVGTVLATASMAAAPFPAYNAVGGLVNIDPADSEGVRGKTFAAEAATPAGVACILF